MSLVIVFHGIPVDKPEIGTLEGVCRSVCSRPKAEEER